MPTRPIITTYLQMAAEPDSAKYLTPPEGITVQRAWQPTISFYRYLYNTVGQDWHWTDRRKLSDTQLQEIIAHPAVEIYVAYVRGVPAGYAELDRRQPPDIELAYFGLIPDFIGQGVGKFLLNWAVHQAWQYQPARFWVHTCTLDHPRAVDVYQKAGFVIYDKKSGSADTLPIDSQP